MVVTKVETGIKGASVEEAMNQRNNSKSRKSNTRRRRSGGLLGNVMGIVNNGLRAVNNTTVHLADATDVVSGSVGEAIKENAHVIGRAAESVSNVVVFAADTVDNAVEQANYGINGDYED